MTVPKLISEGLKKHNNRMVSKIFNSESDITNEIIFNYFKYSGISCSLDGSEDDMFRGYEDS